VCTLLSVALIAAWVLSHQWGVTWFIDFEPPSVPPLNWLPSWRVGSGWIEIGIPYCLPLAPTLAFAAYFWLSEISAIRRRRRVKAGVCPGCRYDRRGLTADAKCPECGTVPAK
jgi:hypothetical protein